MIAPKAIGIAGLAAGTSVLPELIREKPALAASDSATGSEAVGAAGAGVVGAGAGAAVGGGVVGGGVVGADVVVVAAS